MGNAAVRGWRRAPKRLTSRDLRRLRAQWRRYRSERNAARTSVEKSSGSSQAAKWPPLSTSLKYVTPGYTASTQLRGAAKISPGNVVKATGSETGGGGWPDAAASAWARPSSQYDRAAEMPVPVSQ